MRKLFLLLAISFFLSGCTVVHLFFVRNLSAESAEVIFVFDASASLQLPDSLYIPYSSTSHLVNKSTADHMKDSLKFKKITLTKYRAVLPSGSMIMIDKNTSKKVGYHDPLKIEVTQAGKSAREVYFGTPSGDAKTFRVKGKMPVLHWYDIY